MVRSGSIAHVKYPPVIALIAHAVNELWRQREAPKRAVTELARVVRSPALHPAVRDERARMLQASAEADRIYGSAAHGGLEHAGITAVTNLTLAVLSRAAH
jgi:hypothetical protein